MDQFCNIPSINNTSGTILINQKKHKQRVCFDCRDILLIMQITISQAEIYMRNYIRSTCLNPGETHLENQLLPTIGGNNSTVCSAPPLSWITNHAPKQQVTSSRHSILESVKISHDGLIKLKKHSTIIFPIHNTASRAIPVHSYK